MAGKKDDKEADLGKLAKAARERDEEAVAAEADKLPRNDDGTYKT